MQQLSTLWISLYGAWIALEIGVGVGTRSRTEAARRSDRGTQLLLWGTIALALTASGFLRAGQRTPIHAPELALQAATLALMALGLAVRMTAIATLGGAFRANVTTEAGQRLKRTGLYTCVRHPSYLGMEIIFLAIGLHGNDWGALVAALAPTTAAVLWRIHVEEIALRAHFGDEYEQYSRTTRRMIPGIY